MSERDRYAITVVVIVALQGLLSCVHLPAESGISIQETTPLERIGIADLGDRLRVEVDGGRPVVYSMSSSVEPASVTVDLPGYSKGRGLARMKLNKPPVLDVTPTEVTKPREGVRLVFTLTAAVKPDVRIEGTRLFIDFPKAPAGGEPARNAQEPSTESLAATAPEMSASAPTSQPSAAAKTMTKVEVQRGDGEATVVILGDGEFSYAVRRVNRDRLIVDLANVTSPLRLQVLPVDHPLLKQIRIGHHSQKVRLVFDLPQPADYSVKPGTNQLAVRLTASTEPDAPGRPAKSGEPREGEGPTRNVRVAAAGRVPFPERLASIESGPRLAQMAPEIKGSVGPEDMVPPRYVGRRISLDFQGADISNVLRLIADVSGFNIVVGEAVKAKVTLKLISVPWDQALDMMLKINNLGMIREGNIVWIDSLTNIARQQDEEAKAKESKIKAEDLVTRIVYVQNVSAQEMQSTLRQYLSPRGQLQVNPGTNALIVQDTESRIASFTQLVRELDLEVPQVQIEARIVQADTSYSRSLGIQWGISNINVTNSGQVANVRGQPSTSTDAFGAQTSQFMVNLPAAVSGLPTVPGVGFTFGRANAFLLDLRLQAGELLGLTKVIAAPKLTTLDKREAKISQGESIPFQTTSLQGTQTTFVDANLELQVTPQITSRDPRETGKNVLLKIRATRNAVGARSNPAGPSIDKREANTQVVVRDGETMVIGGIFVDSQINTVAGIPYLSRIPVLGWLFKNKSETIARQELLIFLTPTIVKS
ncbi:MAG: type IV pilus secretin PilQ [Nitrospiraceae bacterium]